MSAMLRLVAVVGRSTDAPVNSTNTDTGRCELNMARYLAVQLAQDAKREYDALQKELRNARRELAELGRNP